MQSAAVENTSTLLLNSTSQDKRQMEFNNAKIRERNRSLS